mmetsp:Transcript_1623/g.2441  ORF Transcript_1623/g.2441 Transcript_1623/m.2441 type:complete len:276 (-) Transcript_1623:356-1183(-)|eukprot:CAMPEP_0204841466 /NCGR_PEP_ID=MMETSP1346-20131115/42171_1 /ASSEMBLY_ACC=CAM_ASM_000771 /TAXON_ID=215587 /ORGANISM="Aplanochytrium stocchinoi, Strain GSBS06" /LENGTH=275 /DNA_ID=CAMNT_0051979633 /DNA_START=147 /DNA_END=974 /DNA_ORIENTATION=+
MEKQIGRDDLAKRQTEKFLNSIEETVGGLPVNFTTFEPTPVVSGEDVTNIVTQFGKRIITGSGLFQTQNKVISTLSGILNFHKPNTFWVDHHDHKYIPFKEDTVIGVITHQYAEAYTVDISSSTRAVLPTLAFDGASKRNHPNYPVGTVIYCRVESTSPDTDPELSCMVKDGPKKDWMTGQSLFGELKGGHIFKVSLSLVQLLLDPKCVVLEALANGIAFEVAVGMNGWVWINSEHAYDIVLIVNAVKKSETLNAKTIPVMVKNLLFARPKELST